jgi:threonine synthase
MPDAPLFQSTNGRAPRVTFRDALINGIAPDGGLYMPVEIPVIAQRDIDAHAAMSYPEIAYDVIRRYVGPEVPDNSLRSMCENAYDYAVPLEQVFGRTYVMRLDQGPTASFKDFAARMMGRLMQLFLREERRRLFILTATSGDTGSAIANAFHGLDNIRIIVLFPETEVTNRQRKQMTTLGGNVHIIGIEGKFDDCQAMVKRAFGDPFLAHLPLSSANSINIGRLVPQAVYYFHAFARLRRPEDRGIIFSVPSGNFGDMMGGCLARAMGLPIERFVIAVNANDEFPIYLDSGEYRKIEPSRNCISSAMNVGHPSNLARLVELYGGRMNERGDILAQADMSRMRRDIFSVSVTDEQTRDTIRRAYAEHGLLLEPHGAVGWAGLAQYRTATRGLHGDNPLCVVLETAHPAKFPEEIRRLLDLDPPLPASLEGIEQREEMCDHIPNEYDAFVSRLTSIAEDEPA